jgi:hypothetical protein
MVIKMTKENANDRKRRCVCTACESSDCGRIEAEVLMSPDNGKYDWRDR